MDLIKLAEETLMEKKELPSFKAGDTITVFYKIIEGTKERIQQYQGVVLQRRGVGASQTFTVRKISNGVGAENPELEVLAKEKGIEVTEACTLVLLSIGDY